MSQSTENPPLPTLSEIFNYLLDWYRDPVTGDTLTIRQVAMRTPGVSIDMLYSIKQGRRENIGYDVIEALSAAFGVPPITFFPRLWNQAFTIPPNMKGFRPFPRSEAFAWSNDPSRSD